MSKNKLYDLKYYNEHQKMRFLKTVADNDTQHQLHARILGRVSRAEEMYQKDLYDFSLPEIENFLRYKLNPSKLNTARMNAYAINNYIEWANTQDLRKTNINPLSIMMSEDYYKSFIDESKQTLYSEDEIDDMIRECVNPVDKVLFQLLMEGASGNGLDELLNLQRKNIDFDNNRLLLTDANGSTRILEVSDKCMVLISSALEQTVYIKKNGLYEGSRGAPEIDLVSNDFVIRGTISSKTVDIKSDKFLIYRRLAALAEPDILDRPYLTAKNIRYSGMLKMAKDYYLEHGTLDNVDFYNELGKRFDIKKTAGSYVVFPYKKDFLNVETIKKVYGIE